MKSNLQVLREKRIRGHMIRSRVQNLLLYEKPTKYFCGLEKRNYIDKTIRKLKLQDGSLLTSQKDILNQVKNFYKKLFSNKDSLTEDITLDTVIDKQKITCLQNTEADLLDGQITVKELNEALAKMKNNKTPGIDGFPADFLKVFWNKLRIFILRALNESYRTGSLPISMRQLIISCIPKGDKPRDNLKNWRPISLASVLYKLGSSVIASRIKKVLPKLISTTQTGFLDGRFIGESTRLIYDLMNYTEDNKIDGLLMLIDFEKAFDSISWKFMYLVLEKLGFTSNLIKWVQLFNTDISASVLQFGVLSEFFSIKRGCKQGDPLAPYLFLLCGQILYLLIENNNNIKGITIKNTEFKISQFADDTTLILDGNESSLDAALNTLEVYGTLSGLRMNSSKCKMIWIGRKKHSKDKLNCKCHFDWNNDNFSLLGLHFHVNLDQMAEINYSLAINKVKNTISFWKKRSLTPLGKITVIKTLILSRLNHLFMTIPLPYKGFCKKIDNLLYNFLWDGKPDKVSRAQICQSYANGGLKMINTELFVKALKLTWLRRLITTQNSQWSTLFQLTLSSIKKITDFGPHWFKVLHCKTKNLFWKEIFEIAFSHQNDLVTKRDDNLLCMPLWYNEQISKSNLFKPKWYKHGIAVVGDIISDGIILSKETIELLYDLPDINFLDYYQVRADVNNFLITNLINEITEIKRPYIPAHLKILLKSKTGCKDMYWEMNRQNLNMNYQQKWNLDLNIFIDNYSWKKIYKICFKSLNDNNIIWLQYKILQRILGTKQQLFKMNLSNSEYCRICNSSPETLVHLFVSCKHVKKLWNDLKHWLNDVTDINLNFAAKDIILGYLLKTDLFLPINVIILI